MSTSKTEIQVIQQCTTGTVEIFGCLVFRWCCGSSAANQLRMQALTDTEGRFITGYKDCIRGPGTWPDPRQLPGETVKHHVTTVECFRVIYLSYVIKKPHNNSMMNYYTVIITWLLYVIVMYDLSLKEPSLCLHMPDIFSCRNCIPNQDNLQLPDGSIYSGESDAEFAVSNVSQLSQLKDFEGLGYIRHEKITFQSNLSC